ncbi:MAG: glutamate ABC transporter substrate-binding protein [Chloroflexota bacterium]|nr:glutamate ABC transporter substrate-binding protein [Chloroflexota bacterium]
MREILRGVAIGLAALFVASACGGGGGTGTPQASSTGATASRPKFELSTYMYAIQSKGKLRAGVRDNQVPFGAKDPATGRFEGFDIDMVREVAKGIFGEVSNIDDFIEYTAVVSANRIPGLTDNKFDVVAATMTITAERKTQIDFSDVYFRAGQRVLVKKDNTAIAKIEDTNGKTVCAAKGSTSEKNITAKAPQAKLLLLDDYQACLKALQNGQTDAISTDDAILFGLSYADPNTKLVGPKFSDEPYGIGVKKDRTGFVDFINRTITAMIQDGRWKALYDKHAGKVTGDSKRSPDDT